MTRWLLVSLVLSVGLTIVLNVALRAWPGGASRAHDAMVRRVPADPRRVRVVVPWKAMLVGSLVLTVLANVLIRLR